MSQTVTQSEGTAEQMEVQAVPQVEILTVPKQTIADLFAEHYKVLKQFAPDRAKEMEANPELAQYIPKVQPTPEPPAPVRKLDRATIVGFASHWNKAPFADKDTEVWSLNEFYSVAPEQLKAPLAEGRLRWFEIHRREQNYEGNPFFLHSRESEHAAKLAGLGCPVYMHKHWDDIPNSIAYPKEAMLQHFHGYFTNSISWMIALAIAEGFKEIGIYGVDMAQDSEYSSQRPSCEYLIGWARAQGIRIVMPEECDLCTATYLYGWDSHHIDAFHAKANARLVELRQRRAHNENVMQQARDAANQLLGAEENTRYLLAAHGGIKAGKKG